MRHHAVVFANVKIDMGLQGLQVAELVQVEPAVLQPAEESLDHAVGEGDLDLRDDALEHGHVAEHRIDDAALVLGAVSYDDFDRSLSVLDQIGGLEQHCASRNGQGIVGEMPGKDASREVVDDAGDVGAGADRAARLRGPCRARW